jgi:tRNA(Arg) A34 adenosine deaminase TadA
MAHEAFLKLAIEEALAGIRAGEGGPFGAVVVKDGMIIGKGHNTVLKSHDPTAHAEINAIRYACNNVGDHHLTGAVIYSNFEPCPMCLSAIYWANIRNLVYCAGREEAEKIGFMDSHLYREIALPAGEREMKSLKIILGEMNRLLNEWNGMKGKILY